MDFIQSWKNKVAEKYPNTIYLNHPVHTSFYLINVAQENQQCLLDSFQNIGSKLHSLFIPIKGWKVFCNDPVTKGNTVVLELALTDALAKMQIEIARTFQPLKATPIVYTNTWTDDYLKSYTEYGFPFVGKHWIPHFTVASLPSEAKYWVEKMTAHLPNITSMPLDKLSLYQIDNDEHFLLKTIQFSSK